jgi:hypothetical protein
MEDMQHACREREGELGLDVDYVRVSIVFE